MVNMTHSHASRADYNTINASRDYILQEMTDSQKNLLSTKRENMRNFLPQIYNSVQAEPKLSPVNSRYGPLSMRSKMSPSVIKFKEER